LWPDPKAFCDASVLEVSPFGPSRWGGIAVAPNGDAYVSDSEYHTILKLRGDGTVEHVAGGGGTPCAYERWTDKRESGYRDGPGKQALFGYPQGLAIDREGNLLVADWGNCALRRISPSGEVSTVQKGCYADPSDEKDRKKRINHIYVAVDPQGRPVVGGSFVVPGVNIYSNIHRFHPDGRIEQLLSATKGYANTGELRVEYLSGLAYLPDGRLLIADEYNNLLRAVDGKGLTDWLGAVTTFGPEKDIDGRPPKARVRRPGGLCVAGDGTVFIIPAAPRSGPVRKVDSKTREMRTCVY
jgi:sugar lactone lactonase YvrE